MVKVLQRLLQLAVLVALVFVVVKPEIVPGPAQSIAKQANRWVFGNETSVMSLQNTWLARWRVITTTIPILAQWSQSMPSSAPVVTPDSVTKFLLTTFFSNPVNKWQKIKSGLFSPPPATSSAVIQTP